VLQWSILWLPHQQMRNLCQLLLYTNEAKKIIIKDDEADASFGSFFRELWDKFDFIINGFFAAVNTVKQYREKIVREMLPNFTK